MLALDSLIFSALVAGLAWAVGRSALRLSDLEETESGDWITGFLAFPLGIGIIITLLFVLALAGGFTISVILTVAAILALGSAAVLRPPLPSIRRALKRARGAWWLLPLGVYALLAAMGAPLDWDELSYHLPYARDYAQHGGLVVSENLRYPLHSHNFHLLYALALLFSNELAAHQLHALSGLLVLVGIVLYARETLGTPVAVVAGTLYLVLTFSYFDTASVDLGLAMFVFSGFICLAAWQQHGRPGYLYLSAFMLAMAIGVKYQGLIQLLPFAVALWMDRPSLPTWAGLVAMLFLFGSWWYVRNLAISGDPVHPLGAPLFGYWVWNETDLAGQFSNVASYSHQPSPLLWPALGAAYFVRGGGRQYRNLVILAGGGLLMWYLSSRYDRYLVPTLSFLSILSGHVMVETWRKLTPVRWRTPGIARNALVGFHVVIAALLAVNVKNEWDEICFTTECVNEVQSRRQASFHVRNQYPRFRALSLYQLGLEDELYMLGQPVFGDWFGKYRYTDLLSLEGRGPETAAYLRSIGANGLLVARKRAPFGAYLEQQDLEPALEQVYEDESVVLFVLPGSFNHPSAGPPGS